MVAKASTVAPASAATRATTGAAPLPVPPPSPVTKTTKAGPMQARRKAASSASAATAPRAGSPRPHPAGLGAADLQGRAGATLGDGARVCIHPEHLHFRRQGRGETRHHGAARAA